MLQPIVACLCGLTLFALVYSWSPKTRSQKVKKVVQEIKRLAGRSKHDKGTKPSENSDHKVAQPERQWGQWVADTTFHYPAIQALKSFDIDAVEPIAYRPFR